MSQKLKLALKAASSPHVKGVKQSAYIYEAGIESVLRITEILRHASSKVLYHPEIAEAWDKESLATLERYGDSVGGGILHFCGYRNPERQLGPVWKRVVDGDDFWKFIYAVQDLMAYRGVEKHKVQSVRKGIRDIFAYRAFQSYLETIALNKNTLPPLVE